MTPREYQGRVFKAVRADEVTVGSNVLVYHLQTGMHVPKFVTKVELVGDDVEIYSWQRELFSTSQGNTVMVEV